MSIKTRLITMEQNIYDLSWKTFDEHQTTTFKSLLTDQNFKDVTLVSDDHKQLTAHKIVLCASSPLLASILINNPHSNPLLFMRGLKTSQMEKLLDFIYLGKAEVHAESLNDFMNMGKDLKIKGLYQEEIKENQCNEAGITEMKTELVADNKAKKISEQHCDDKECESIEN